MAAKTPVTCDLGNGITLEVLTYNNATVNQKHIFDGTYFEVLYKNGKGKNASALMKPAVSDISGGTLSIGKTLSNGDEVNLKVTDLKKDGQNWVTTSSSTFTVKIDAGGHVVPGKSSSCNVKIRPFTSKKA